MENHQKIVISSVERLKPTDSEVESPEPTDSETDKALHILASVFKHGEITETRIQPDGSTQSFKRDLADYASSD